MSGGVGGRCLRYWGCGEGLYAVAMLFSRCPFPSRGNSVARPRGAGRRAVRRGGAGAGASSGWQWRGMRAKVAAARLSALFPCLRVGAASGSAWRNGGRAECRFCLRERAHSSVLLVSCADRDFRAACCAVTSRSAASRLPALRLWVVRLSRTGERRVSLAVPPTSEGRQPCWHVRS